jgi:hypothetical protein
MTDYIAFNSNEQNLTDLNVLSIKKFEFRISCFEFNYSFEFHIFFDVFNNVFCGGTGLKDFPDSRFF